jgi:single-strand DNA-binding protein
MNVVVLHGALSRDPEVRELPSGDRLGAFEVTVRSPDQPTESVPVVWVDPPDRALRLAAGAEVVVAGRIRRRFFRTPAGTGSRTEVVASQVVPATQRKRVAGIHQGAIATLEPGVP